MALWFSGTTGSIASNASATVAHGLGTAPDEVNIQEITPASLDVQPFVTSLDATNVIAYNAGTAAVTNATIVAKIAHTLVK